MRKSALALFAFVAASFSACVKETTVPPVHLQPGKQLLVSNEGNFQSGNASLSLYQLDSQYLASEDIFSYANNRPVGDVLQSLSLVDQRICLVVNNSGKLEFLDPATFRSTGTLSGLRAPRYICQAGPGSSKALVSDIYDDSLAIVQLKPELKIIGKTALKGWTESLVYYNGNFFVTNPQSPSLYVIDATDFVVTDSIPIGFASFAIVLDAQNKLWVATKGEKNRGIQSQVHRIDPETKQVLLSKNVSSDPIQCMTIDNEGKNIYLVRNDVYHFSSEQEPDFSQPFFKSENNNFYGISAGEGKIFLADAIDYNQNGTVFILDKNANIISQFKVGKIPNGFLIVN